jgi:transcriptional regulator with XRE-family HTH domain
METAQLLQGVRARSGLSLRALASRAGTSHATLSAYEHGRVDPTVATATRIARAAGFDLTIDLVPRVDDEHSPRGEELIQVLELAAHFPARHSRELRYPPFGRP